MGAGFCSLYQEIHYFEVWSVLIFNIIIIPKAVMVEASPDKVNENKSDETWLYLIPQKPFSIRKQIA